MSDDNQNLGADAQKQDDDGKEATLTAAEVHALQEELTTTRANLENARKGEKFHKSERAKLEEQLKGFVGGEDFKTKYEALTTEHEGLKTTVKNQTIDSALKSKLEEAGAISVNTVLKLVDKSKIAVNDGQVDAKSIEDVISELKKTDEVLFTSVKTPAVKRPNESESQSSFKTEMDAAKTEAEVKAVLKKFGMGSTI
ncbi:hypothetical protein QTI05_24080 [Variovorax sp. J22R193]|uniref:phage scaffolding protein n=1 Tax=Variovorax fucosicus TaxID=3053517 RepID=UPI002577EA41|nr:phage scaffolding protein [Variovorax sp. J22R193]MDM0042138.1 hypothetical protein [Variovorax sp. J22R193]